ncbi:MAG: hypothetical protein ACYTBJ_11345 [Planctomycetota bacterium]|jgi:hypothetical protein
MKLKEKLLKKLSKLEDKMLHVTTRLILEVNPYKSIRRINIEQVRREAIGEALYQYKKLFVDEEGT